MPIIEGTGKVVGQLGIGRAKVAIGLYDFTVDGGAVGNVTLRGDILPAGAIVYDSLINVDTPLTSGGAATVGIQVETAVDVNDADAISGSPWSTATAKRMDLTGADLTIVKTTARRSLVAVVGVAALTAGKFTALVWYVEL